MCKTTPNIFSSICPHQPVCRALGLPCRSLTNFESAHDTDKTATIDSYADENGEDMPEHKSDSIWFVKHDKIIDCVHNYDSLLSRSLQLS